MRTQYYMCVFWVELSFKRAGRCVGGGILGKQNISRRRLLGADGARLAMRGCNSFSDR